MSFTSLAAQDTLTAGDKVRVTIAGKSSPVVGFWISSTETRLTLTTEDRDSSLVLPLASLTKLEVVRGQKSKWVTGAIIGAVPVAALGAIAGGISAGIAEQNDPAGLVVLGGVVGAAVGGGLGALIGSFIKVDRWEEVSLDNIRVSLTPIAPGGLGAILRVTLSR